MRASASLLDMAKMPMEIEMAVLTVFLTVISGVMVIVFL
jgi:hypothetical protein